MKDSRIELEKIENWDNNKKLTENGKVNGTKK